MRQGKHERAQSKKENARAQPARLVSDPTKIADGDEAQYWCDVIAAGNKSRLLARQVESLLDCWNHNADETIYYDALKIELIQQIKSPKCLLVYHFFPETDY